LLAVFSQVVLPEKALAISALRGGRSAGNRPDFLDHLLVEDFLKPAECAGLSLSVLVIGSGSFGSASATANELLIGSAGTDRIQGGHGDDCLVGGAGNDTLRGGTGTDVCIGGGGTDTFSGCETIYQ